MEAGLSSTLEGQLAAAISSMQLQERRKCEYYSCTNYTSLQQEGEKLLVCSGCKTRGVVTVYCTVECQKSHWKEHQLRCKKTSVTVTTTTTTIEDKNPPPLGEQIATAPVISQSNLLELLSKFASLPTQGDDDDDEDEDEDEDGDEDDEDEDEDEEEEEDQDVDSMGRALPQNRKKRRPMFSFGGRQDESDEDDEGEQEKSKAEEKVDPFLPFGPISEGTNYWNFSGPAAEQGAEQSPNSKNAVPLKLATKKKRTPARKAGEEAKPAEELSSLSFSFTPSSATEETKSSTETSPSSSAPVFTFGGDASAAVPSFAPGVTTSLPTSLPETFQFGK